MKTIKTRSIEGRKFVVKELSAKDKAKLCTTYNYQLTIDGEIEWETDNQREMLEFLADWGK